MKKIVPILFLLFIGCLNYPKDSKDLEKNMEFLFDKKSNQLFSFGEIYIPSAENIFKNVEISEMSFKNYFLKEPYDDAASPIIFNTNYGVLGIGNVTSPDFIYLPNDKKNSIEEILKILNQ